jgi:hypothetical protein
MMPNVIGWDEAQATAMLTDQGYLVKRALYVSRRGIDGADSTRVIRQRELGEQRIEITVSHFKTQVDNNWA